MSPQNITAGLGEKLEERRSCVSLLTPISSAQMFAATYEADVIYSELRIMTATVAIIIGLYHIKFFDSVFKLLLEEILSFEISLPVKFFSFTLTLHSAPEEENQDSTLDDGFIGANKDEIKNEAIVSLKRKSEEMRKESTAPVLSPLMQLENYFSPNKLNVMKIDCIPVIPASNGIIMQSSLEDRGQGQLTRGTSEIIESEHIVANILFSDGCSEVPLCSRRVASRNNEKIVSEPNFSSYLHLNATVGDNRAHSNCSSTNASDLQEENNDSAHMGYENDYDHVHNNCVHPTWCLRDVADKIKNAIFEVTFNGFWNCLISTLCHLSNLKGKVIIKDLRVCSPPKDIDPRWENENIVTVKNIKVTFHFFRTLFYFVFSFGDFIYFEFAEVQGLSIFVEGYDEKNKNRNHALPSTDHYRNYSSRDEKNDRYVATETEKEKENENEKEKEKNGKKENSDLQNDSTDLNYYYNNIMNSININNISKLAKDCKVDGLLPLPLSLPLPFSTAISSSPSTQSQADSRATASLNSDMKPSSNSCSTHILNSKGQSKNKTSDYTSAKSDIVLNISLLGASTVKIDSDIPISNPGISIQKGNIESKHLHGKGEEVKTKTIIGSLLSPSFNPPQPVVPSCESRTRIDTVKDNCTVKEGGLRDGRNSSDTHIFPIRTDIESSTYAHCNMKTNTSGETFENRNGTSNGDAEGELKFVQGRVVDSLPSKYCATNINNQSNITIGSSIFSTSAVSSSMNINSVSRIVPSNFMRSIVERSSSLRKDVDKVIEFAAAEIGKEKKKDETPYALFNTLCGQAKDQFSNDVRLRISYL